MVQKSGQSLSPCVEVNGHMLADVSGDEVEAYLLKAGVVQPTAVKLFPVEKRSCTCQFGNYLRVTEGYLRMAESPL
jgi:hypothetical protein